jgi:hypothetical protein
MANADDHDKSCYDPQLLGFINGLNNPTYMTIRDNLAYIIENNTSFVIIDISNPEFMILLSRTQIIIEQADAITLNGDVAYLRHDNNGFSVYNIADPTDPWFVRPYDINFYNAPLVTNADYMYLGKGNIFNIARPMAPVLDRYDDNWNTDPIGMTKNNYALALDTSEYDISDPLNPILINNLPGSEQGISRFKVYDPYTIGISFDNSTLWIIDPFRYLPQTRRSSSQFHQQAIPAKDAAARKSIVYVAGDTFEIYDASVRGHWQLIANYTGAPGLDNPTQVEIVGETVFITDTVGNLAAYRFKTNPVGSHSIGGATEEIKIVGNLALVATDIQISGGLFGSFDIFDVSDPTNPTRLSTREINYSRAVDSIGSTALVATRYDGLIFIDFTDPENPQIIGTYVTGIDPKLPPSTQDVTVVGNLAYVVDYYTGLHILNVSDPAKPQVVSITDLTNQAEEITVHEKLAIISYYGPDDIEIYDISDPASPTLLSTIPPHPEPGVGVKKTTVHNNLLYTAEFLNGYRVFDITNPSKPIELARIHTDVDGFIDVSHEVVIRGNTLYLANGSAGLYIFDNTDPTNPILLDRIPASIPQTGYRVASYRNIALRDNLAYLASFDAGLRIVDINGCAPPCTPDFNNDGTLNFLDISAFITALESREPASDINADARFNFFDISTFLTLFAQGCP